MAPSVCHHRAMKKKQPPLVKTTIRVPADLLKSISSAATVNCHSFNAETIAALRSWLAQKY